jgi:hypothetical protein
MQSFTKAGLRLTRLARYRFSAGHHDVVAPELSLTQNWVARTQFSSIEGLQDLNYHLHEEIDDPYPHLEGKSFLSYTIQS